jgi:hypothetical protein
VPAQNRFRLYHLNYTRKVGPKPNQPSQDATVDTMEATQPRRHVLQGKVKLVAKK